MVITTTSSSALLDCKAEWYFLFVDKENLSKSIATIEKKFFPQLTKLLKQREFTASSGEMITIPVSLPDKKGVVNMLLIGLGDGKEGIDIEQYRRALAKGIRIVSGAKGKSIALSLPPKKLFFDQDNESIAKETAIIANMTLYHFDQYITDKKRKSPEAIDITISVSKKEQNTTDTYVKEGECIARAVNKARHWIDLPPTFLTPPYLADKAKNIAKNKELDVTVFNENQIQKMGMGGLAAVSRGSDLDCRLVIMEYKAKKKTAPTIAFVGKGITFDSGGLSIKPARFMETMKEDMSGASAVIATMEALADLKPDVNVIGITPLAENLPSGSATKPGDIVQFYNGKTAEIRNTDAEGRLILADALSYAVKHYELDAIIDIATLTGACAYALGPFYTGLMSEDDDLSEIIKHAGDCSGDYVWSLPMGDDYKKAIVSSVADICNIGNEKIMAGATTAAHFLQHFVNDVPWAHLDIAGTAFDVPNIPYYRTGATGVGVRLLIELAMQWDH